MCKLVLLIGMLLAKSLTATELSFFEKQEIDYWHEKNVAKATKAQDNKEKMPADPSWETYLEPKSLSDLKEVFREGEHTPPVPLLMGIQNPTYENAKKWMKYIQVKNNLARPFMDMIAKIKLGENDSQTSLAVSNIQTKMKNNVAKAADYDRFRFRMYFDSNCPHCKNMFETLRHLREEGYYVESVQIDKGPTPNIDLPIFRASEEELAKYANERVPFTLVADMRRARLIEPIRGYHSIISVSSYLNQVRSMN